MSIDRIYTSFRRADDQTPAGWTVSKNPTLPKGDFRITEYVWPDCSLWFVDQDRFSRGERELAYRAFVAEPQKAEGL